MQRNLDPKPHPQRSKPITNGSTPFVSSSELFCGGNTLRIDHAGQVYQLRITRENKLILTK